MQSGFSRIATQMKRILLMCLKDYVSVIVTGGVVCERF
jgi:hypothetical protein